MADGVNERFDFQAALPALSQVPAVHMIAVGGSGMSGIARLLLERGVPLSGTDQNDLPVLDELRALGAEVEVGYAADRLAAVPDGALVVVSSAIPETNPELAEARRRGLAVLHRSQALAVLMDGRRGLAVAGANGKTTTSAMVTVALRGLGADPTFAIGAPIAGVGANAGGGQGPDVVVEADESDGSFVVYHPSTAIVVNIRPDHLDFYGTPERLGQAYDEFARTVQPGGLLVACADDPGSAALARARAESGARVLTYGESPSADLRLSALETRDFTGTAVITLADGVTLNLRLNVPGRHNLLNAGAVVLALSEGLGHDPASVVTALQGFRGTSRRFEPRGEAGGVRVVDDYAHNPGKLEATVRTGLGLRDGGRLLVVFQPHLYSRTADFADEFAAALRDADAVVVLDVYGAREQPVEGVTGRLISDQVPGAVFAPDIDAALEAALELARPGDLLLTVGAGDVTALGPRLLERLAARES